MLRLLELALFLAPFAAYAAFLGVSKGGGPSVPVLVTTLVGLALLGGALAWFGVERAGAPNAQYVPAHLEDGRIIDGHSVPPSH
jgi:hypothetical protein